MRTRNRSLAYRSPLPRLAPLAIRGAIITVALVLIFSCIPVEARADEAVDTVVLQSGTKLRGMVMVDDSTGVSIKLLDGTSRTIKRSEVAHIDYGEGPKAPASQAAPPVDSANQPVAEQQAVPPAGRRGPVRDIEENPNALDQSRTTGIPALWITGLSTFGAAYLTAIIATAVLVDDNDRGLGVAYAFIPLFGGVASFAEDNFDIRSPYTEIIVADAVLQHLGAALFIIGLTVPGQRNSADLSLGTSGSTITLGGSF